MTTIQSLITLPYEIARMPVVFVDGAVITRLPEDSPARMAFDKLVGLSDQIAGSVLHSPDIAKRGADRIERGAKLAKAAGLEAEAEVRREQATDLAEAAREKAATKRKAAQEHAADGLDEAEEAERRGKEQAAADARKAATARKAAADKRAAARKAEADRREQAVKDAAEAVKDAKVDEVKSEVDEARDTKASADAAREDAERLEGLVEAKKDERKS